MKVGDLLAAEELHISFAVQHEGKNLFFPFDFSSGKTEGEMGVLSVYDATSLLLSADIYSPVSGEIIAINTSLNETTLSINQSPQTAGWLFKLKLTDPTELDQLLDETEYGSLL